MRQNNDIKAIDREGRTQSMAFVHKKHIVSKWQLCYTRQKAMHVKNSGNGEILDELLGKWEAMGYRFKSLDELPKAQGQLTKGTQTAYNKPKAKGSQSPCSKLPGVLAPMALEKERKDVSRI